MIPNYDLAATKAMEILVYQHITETPISSMPILLNYPGVRVMSFSDMADLSEISRSCLIPMFGYNQDAITFRMEGMEGVNYVVIYNMHLPHEQIRRSIARELGHIVLGHDGQTRPDDVRMAEAICFAHHLLTPRPIIHMIQSAGIPFTMNVLAHTTGCSEDCIEELRTIPGANVSADLNLQVHDLFAPHIREYIRFHVAAPKPDHSSVIDFGTYMDNYNDPFEWWSEK